MRAHARKCGACKSAPKTVTPAYAVSASKTAEPRLSVTADGGDHGTRRRKGRT